MTGKERRVLRKIWLFSMKRKEVRQEVLYGLAYPKVQYKSLAEILELIDSLRDPPDSGRVVQ